MAEPISLLVWIAIFGLSSLFWAWIIFGGGADWLEGSLLSGFLVSWLAPRWSADGIKLFAVLTWLVQGIWFVIGLFHREMRF